MMLFKQVVIKVFGLADISDMLKKTKENQKKDDKDFWKEKMEYEMNILKREHSLELQERDATISMLEDTIKYHKDREKEVTNKEFLAKKQIKENSFVIRQTTDFMREFAESVNGIYGRMDKLKDVVEGHKERIENHK